MASSSTRGRKRNRAPDNDENTAENNKNKKQKTNPSDEEDNDVEMHKATRLQLVDLSEYNCCVCKEISIGKILQCPNGCVICDACYPKLQPCKCPICRIAMSRNKPIRCRLAEKTLALRLVTCKYDGCGREVAFGRLKQHELNECEYKPIGCTYADLGCCWQGLRRNHQKHVAKCKMDRDAVLQRVQDYKRQMKLYRSFIKGCNKIHHHSCGVSGEQAFVSETDEFFIEGYEHVLKIKSERLHNDTYRVSIQLCFAEDLDNLSHDETLELELGVLIEPNGDEQVSLMKQIKVTLSERKAESDWINLQPELAIDRYQKAFRGGFDVKVFEFADEDDI